MNFRPLLAWDGIEGADMMNGEGEESWRRRGGET
jgi:hypothetical protein